MRENCSRTPGRRYGLTYVAIGDGTNKEDRLEAEIFRGAILEEKRAT